MTPCLVLAALLASSADLPRLVQTPPGQVPYGANAAGAVGLEATISNTGSVTGVRAIKALEPFTGPFTDAVRTWQAEPAREGGVAVASQLLVLGVFRPPMLTYPAPPPPERKDYGVAGKLPVPTRWVVPGYPPMAVGNAAVAVEVTVGETGSVTDAHVTASTPGFDDAAVAAVRQWTFTPVLRDGKPVPSRLAVVFFFPAPH
jgi:TonB family protein